MLLQLEQQFLQASLAQAHALLAGAAEDDDPIGQHQLDQLVQELEGKLAAMPAATAKEPAGVALFFSGGPVVATAGIHADFGGKAIQGFQNLVRQRFAAQEIGPLSSKGPVPLKDNTHLLVTDVVRDSFGFVLEGVQPDAAGTADNITLVQAIDKVADTLSCVAAQDDALFDSAAAEIDERQKSALTDFFKLLDTEGATMRIVEGERDFELDHAAVQRARSRVENMRISERTEQFEGKIVGWTDHSAKFELWVRASGEIIAGGISRRALEKAAAEGFEPYHKQVRVSLKAREVAVRNRQPKVAYTLLGIEPLSPLAN